MIICAVCGTIPARCTCPPSPLQRLLEAQHDDAALWFKPVSDGEKALQKALTALHTTINEEMHKGEANAEET